MRAKDLMSISPVCCFPDTSLREAARLMTAHDCGSLPVIDGETTRQPLGVITDRDIVTRVVAAGRHPAEVTVRDCMSGPCVTVAASSTLDDCCDAMEASQIRRLVVVDEEDRVVGVIAQADVVAAASAAKTAEVLREISLPQDALHATF